MSTPRRLTPGDLEAAVDVLAAAFHEDPAWVDVVPDETHRRRVLPPLFRRYAATRLGRGHEYGIGDPLDAIAFWSLPGRQRPRRTARHLAPVLLRPHALIAAQKAQRVTRVSSALRRQHISRPHTYLDLIAVAPRAQGRGLASALLRAVLTDVDHDVYLDTVNPDAVPRYLRHGFEVIAESRVPRSSVTVWLMRRPATARGR